MASTIKLKNGSGAPTTGDLVQGEPALDLTNKRLYTENASGVVIEVGTSPSTIDINAGTIDGTVIGGSSAAAGSFTTISASGEIAANGGVAFGDNDVATFGASDDLQIYHDGSNSYIAENGTGNLVLKGTNLTVESSTGENYFVASANADTRLYYDNAQKLATTSTGIDVTGTANVGGVYNTGIYNQTAGDTQFWVPNVGEAVRIQQNTGSVGIGTSSPTARLDIAGMAAGEVGLQITSPRNDAITNGLAYINVTDSVAPFAALKINHAGTGPAIVALGNVGIGTSTPARPLHISTSGVIPLRLTSTGTDCQIELGNSGGTPIIGSFNDQLIFNTASTERMRITSTGACEWRPNGTTQAMTLDSSGNLLLGTTSQTAQLTVNNGGNNYPLWLQNSSSSIDYPNRVISSYATGGQTATMFSFLNASETVVGTIKSTVTSTSYNTSSDQRLKDNIVDANDAGNKIDAIQVRQYDWKADGSHQDYGMIAQELMTVAPEAVSGDPESDEMMGVDYSKLVPMLIKEIQSLRARVAQLEGAN